MESVVGARTLLRHRAMFVLVVALLIATNTTTFMYATRLFNRAEPVRCTNAMALELGSFTTNSVSQNLLTAERSGTVREHLQIMHESLLPKNLNRENVSPITHDHISEDNTHQQRGANMKVPGDGEIGSPFNSDDGGKMLKSSSKIEPTLGDPTTPDEHMEGGENETPPTNTSDCTPCDCKDPEVTKIVHGECPAQQQEQSLVRNKTSDNTHMKTVFIITPTYHRTTQKIDLNSMCHTLMSVPKVVWIIIEDSSKPTDFVTRLIQRCNVKIVHLVVPTSSIYKQKKGKPWQNLPRGVEQRNAGLNWLREHYSSDNCNGAFYFGDDDNKYDLRLFEDIRNTQSASVWKVAWAGGLQWEGPTCRNGKATSWHSYFAVKTRVFPLDMAGFAVHLCQLFKHPKARVGVNIHGQTSKNGFLETDFLQHFANKSTVECRGSETETYVWHSHTTSPSLHNEKKAHSNKAVETG